MKTRNIRIDTLNHAHRFAMPGRTGCDPYKDSCNNLAVGVAPCATRRGNATRPPKGFSLIELLVVIALSGMLFIMGAFSYQYWVTQQRVQFDAQTIYNVLNTAREIAMLRGHAVSVCGDESCKQNWQEQILLLGDSPEQNYKLTDNNSIIIRAFPQTAQQIFTFYTNGYTASQNASIYICPRQHQQFAQKVVINQAGRIYISNENVEEYCKNEI